MSSYPEWVEERFGDDIPDWAEERWGDDDRNDDNDYYDSDDDQTGSLSQKTYQESCKEY